SDCVRGLSAYRNQSPWHYDNIPICGNANYSVYCRDGNCATAAIERAIRALRNPNAALKDQQRAFARLVHFIADIHQPLHASDNSDRGGNEIEVAFSADWSGARTSQNLHAIWDRELVDYALGADEQTDRARIGALADAYAQDWTSGNVKDWAQQS